MTIKTQWLRRKIASLYFKIVKEKASPEYIARGWAIGMFYGTFIPFGLQLVCSIPTSFILKGSKIGATLGTLITNPVTVFLIYPAQCYLGSLFIGGGLSFEEISRNMMNILQPADVWYEPYLVLFNQSGRLIASFFIGGALLAAVMTPFTYFLVHSMVTHYRALLERRKEKRRLRKEMKRHGKTLKDSSK